MSKSRASRQREVERDNERVVASDQAGLKAIGIRGGKEALQKLERDRRQTAAYRRRRRGY